MAKYALEDLYVGSIIVHFAGEEIEDDKEDLKRWGWADKVGAKAPEEDATKERMTGAGYKAEQPATPAASRRASARTNPKPGNSEDDASQNEE